jgi:cardiolipin synthase
MSRRDFFRRLQNDGIEVAEFRPLDPVRIWKVNNRDHRKLVIVDGRVAFTGGINISDTYASGSSTRPGKSRGRDEGWRDTQVEVSGPAVKPLQSIFLATWTRLGRHLDPQESNLYPPLVGQGDALVQVVASDGGDKHEYRIYDAYLAAIRNARQRIWITQAYFAPDERISEALVHAAGRGVDVRVIVPGFTDSSLIFYASRSSYGPLLEGGVKLYEFRNALLHAKTAVVDGVWSTVGSCNIDPRSFAHNNELNAAIVGRNFARAMEAMFHRDLAQSVRIDAAAWKDRPRSARLKEFMSNLFRYWL